MIIPYHVKDFEYSNSEVRECINDAKPFLLKNKSIDISPELKTYYANCLPNEINFITMIDMHPSKCLDYSFNDLLQNQCSPFIDRYLNNKGLDYN